MTQELFTKDQSAFFSPVEIGLIFENNQRYFNISNKIEGLSIPRPVSYTQTSLTYEYISGIGYTLRDAWFVGDNWDIELFQKIGRYLGQLHAAQGNLSQKIFLHGDFMPHNIVVRAEDVVFFDIEPPGIHRDFDYFYHNYNYVDVTSFILSILISHSFKTPWKFFMNKKLYIQAFIDGYENISSFTLDCANLSSYLSQSYENLVYAIPQNSIKFFLKLVFIKFTVFFQINIYKALK